MGTEEEYVYAIIETVNKGLLSDDKKIDERVVRSFLRTYRSSALAKHSMNGLTINDECFQHLGELEFSFLKSKQFFKELPKIIRLQNNFGLFFEKNGENIPVLNSEEYALGIKTLISSKLPKAKLLGSKAVVYVGNRIAGNCGNKPSNNLVLNDFHDEMIVTSGTKITLDVYAVLEDPDDAPGYDWTSDPFPCPSELMEDIKTKIYAKEFNLILQVKPDKTTDGNDEDSGQQARQS